MHGRTAPGISFFIAILLAAIVLFGFALGFLYSSLPAHHPQRDEESCERVGGQWSDEGLRCLLAYKQPGEPCADGAQCASGICSPPALSEEQRTALATGPLTDMVGTCSPDDRPTGCVGQVIMGTVSKETLCLSG